MVRLARLWGQPFYMQLVKCGGGCTVAHTVATGIRTRRIVISLIGLSNGTSLTHIARDVLVSSTEDCYTHRDKVRGIILDTGSHTDTHVTTCAQVKKQPVNCGGSCRKVDSYY